MLYPAHDFRRPLTVRSERSDVTAKLICSGSAAAGACKRIVAPAATVLTAVGVAVSVGVADGSGVPGTHATDESTAVGMIAKAADVPRSPKPMALVSKCSALVPCARQVAVNVSRTPWSCRLTDAPRVNRRRQ